QRIGLAIADSVYGPWERFNAPILTTRPRCFDSFMVNNPAPVVKPDGSVILMYKSMGYTKDMTNALLFDLMKMSVATAPYYTGPYQAISEKAFYDPKEFYLEDPFIWQNEEGQFSMIAKDMNGNTCGEPRGGVFATSEDGLEWILHKNKLEYSRNILWSDGIVRQMGNLERPFILFEEGQATHMFFATSDGIEGLSDCKNTWNMVIPLKSKMK
ncbi:MAG: glycoside hydrolase family protein, partial [Niameybacter sp.]